jgi:hypothetical protein
MDTNVKLTRVQRDTLEAVKAGLVWRSERIGDLYATYRDDTGRRVAEKTLEPLVCAGLIRIGRGNGTSRPWLAGDIGI